MTYRYAGDDMVGDIPEYTITELPEGYVENQEERIATQIQVSILYQSDTGYPITLHYIYLQQGAASQFVLDSTDDVVTDTVNGYEAYILLLQTRKMIAMLLHGSTRRVTFSLLFKRR